MNRLAEGSPVYDPVHDRHLLAEIHARVYMLLRVVVLPVGHQTTRPASSPRCCVRPDTNSDTDTDTDTDTERTPAPPHAARPRPSPTPGAKVCVLGSVVVFMSEDAHLASSR